MILDNSRIHHAAELQPFLKKHPHLHLVFLPPYSPNLNPVEGFMAMVKSRRSEQRLFLRNFTESSCMSVNFMKRVNKHPIDTVDRLLIRIKS